MCGSLSASRDLKIGRLDGCAIRRQRVERRPGALALAVVAQLLGQRLNRALVPDLAERADRRVAHLGARIVDRLEQGVAGRLHLQAADDAGGAGTDGRIVVVEGLEQPGDRGLGQLHADRPTQSRRACRSPRRGRSCCRRRPPAAARRRARRVPAWATPRAAPARTPPAHGPRPAPRPPARHASSSTPARPERTTARRRSPRAESRSPDR